MFDTAIRVLLFLVGLTFPLEKLNVLRFTIGPMPMMPNKTLTFMLLGLTAVHWIVAGRRLPWSPKTPWMLALYFAMAISAVWSYSMGTPVRYLAIMWSTYLSLVLFYFVLSYTLQSRKEFDLFVWALCLGAAAHALSIFVLGDGGGGRWQRGDVGVGAGSNKGAGNLVMMIPVAFMFFVSARAGLKRVMVPGMLLLYVAGFASQISRSAFLALLSVGGLWLYRFRRPENIRYVVVVLFLAAASVVFFPERYLTRLTSIYQLGSTESVEYKNDYGRWLVYKAGMHAFVQNPILGVGEGRFVLWANEHGYAIENDVHIAFEQVASMYGLLGFIPYFMVIFITWRDFSRSAARAQAHSFRNDTELAQLRIRALFMQMGFLAIVVTGQFQPGAFWRGPWMMMGVATALTTLIDRRIAELQQDSRAPEPEMPEVLPALGFQPAAHPMGPSRG